jgi:hypothetical protein
MSNLSEWLPNYKVVYGDYTDPHPTSDSMTAALPFVPKESRNGRTFNVPVMVSPEQGQTADVSGTAFAIRDARNSVMKEASLDGASLLYNGRIPYDAMLRSRNGTGDKRNGNAFKDAFELKTKGLMEQGEFYNEVAMHYGPGTSAAIADDIGVTAAAGGSGTNLGSPGVVVPITIATWAPGVWARMTNALVDVYAADGTTLIANNVTVSAINPDYAPGGSPVSPNLTLIATTTGNQQTTTGAATTLANMYSRRIVPAGWAQNSCIGVVSRTKNTGIQDGINAALYQVWKPVQVTTTGTLTRLKIASLMARMFPTGIRKGGKLWVSAPVFADLVEEMESQKHDYPQGDLKQVGTNELTFKSPCGPLSIMLDPMMKYGTAIFWGSEARAVRVGSSPLTFRGKGDEWFFLELQGNAGSEIRCMSNQTPFFYEPNKTAAITGIVPNALI